MNAFPYSNIPVSKGDNCPDRQLPPTKIATQLGLAFGLVLELVLGLGGNFP